MINHALSKKPFSHRAMAFIFALLFLGILLNAVYFFYKIENLKSADITVIKNSENIKENIKNKEREALKRTQAFHDMFHQHLFGEALPDPDQWPLSALPFKLTGILYSDVEKESQISLMISSEAQEKFYRAGDILPNGVIIEKIFPRYVVIQNRQRYERLVIYPAYGVYEKNKTD